MSFSDEHGDVRDYGDLFALWLPFALAQDVPRHWIAHFLWVPLPFWFLGAKVHEVLWRPVRWKIKKAVSVAILFVVFCWGLWAWKPWQLYFQQKEFLNLPRATSIRVSAQEKVVTQELVSFLQSRSKPEETIFVFPAQPTLYFLANRKGATSFPNFHGGWRWQDHAVKQLMQDPPSAVVSCERDCVWGLSGFREAPLVLAWIRQHCTLEKRVAVYELYSQCRGNSSPGGRPSG